MHLHLRTTEGNQIAINGESVVYYSETKKLLQEAISRLPAQTKKVYTLRQEGYHYEEIAKQLGTSKNTVRNQLVTATRNIQAFLKEKGLPVILFFP